LPFPLETMANEATLVIQTAHPINFTCADGAGIVKGTIVKLGDSYTVSASSGANDKFGGIVAADKIANDGVTKIPIYRQGVFRLTASGAVASGAPVRIKTANIIEAVTSLSGANIIGTALQNQGDVTGNILVELNPRACSAS